MTARDAAPATAAGRALLDDGFYPMGRGKADSARKRVLAIEAESRQQGRDEERERVRAALIYCVRQGFPLSGSPWVYQSDLLAILAAAAGEGGR